MSRSDLGNGLFPDLTKSYLHHFLLIELLCELLVSFYGVHLRTISQRVTKLVLYNEFVNITLRITVTSLRD